MKPSNLILIFLIMAFTGGAALVYLKAQTPDLELISNDINKYLLKIDNINSNINELALKNRVNLDTSYDELVQATKLLDRTLGDLENKYFSESLMQGSKLEKYFTNFRQVLEIKKGLIESFKTHNSVLRNSETYAPVVGRELINITKELGLTDAVELYGEVVLSVLEYARFDAKDNTETINELLSKLKSIEVQMPVENLSSVIEFTNHANTMLIEKEKTDGYLQKALSSNSNVSGLLEAWDRWVIEKSSEKENLDFIVLLYVTFLLVFTSLIGLRLRKLYVSLDTAVVETSEIAKKTKEELVQSEKLLMQSEKMASLGKAISGVSHELTVPLSLLTDKINLVMATVAELDTYFSTSETLYKTVSQKPVDTKKLKVALKNNVGKYRKIRTSKTIYNLDKLLKDTLTGLDKISKKLDLLEKFDQLDSGEVVTTNLNVELDSTIKICQNRIGKRKLNKLYSSYLPKIKSRANQISHVIMNVLINAVQHTDEVDGVITVETTNKDDGIYIIIKDNGEGMDEQTCKNVCDPFFTFNNEGESQGLGMSIAFKIVENHGGNIMIESTPDIGTQVTIKLPNNRPGIKKEK